MNAHSHESAPAILNIPLLDRLRTASGFVSTADLAESNDRERLAADLDALEAFGFRIERHPYLGAAYRGPSPRLCPDQIEHELGTRRIGRRIAVWNRLGSTSDAAARGAGAAANDGLVILAEEQTTGRGQRGRSWSAPPRSCILMSVLLFPPSELSPIGRESAGGTAWLTALGAVATAGLVAEWTGCDARIKWPNDVRVDGRKVAGILVERVIRPRDGSAASEPETAVVVGVGLNVNLGVDDLAPELRGKATSLRILSGGGSFDRSELVRDLIRRLDRWYDEGVRDGPSSLNAAWRGLSEHLGRRVRVTTPLQTLAGRLVDLDFQRGLTIDPSDETGSQGSCLVHVPISSVVALEG
ncbi:MAG: biotin--[acetyl-CoA-carboxylase] ligase [Paludisphaera borealis]|uniref:biotin--[acetyl-CoA-carboxylase] ligase n=1 Tax=Paludisphaera borealis TaxID=1387353 RepID=UPI002844A978|nr:biotin--[acetyl-CoA-carboxylase] ligase [Paludisphaera borealis]MDR3619851.1 biotin--[acetyl-CoA-carboxylase] ligase [Paludisphaera borealis]